MVAFIDEYRGLYGVEPICAVLPIAPSTYYRFKNLERNPEKQSDRVKRYESLAPEVQRVWDENRGVYGARPDSILIMSYAKLFSDIEQLEKIFAFLDLDIEDETMAFWDENTLKKQMIEQKKVSIMTDDIRHSIQMDADFETYQILQTMEEEYYVKY